MSEDNKTVALRFMEAMGTNDPDLAASCLAPECFTITKGYGKFTGRRDAATMVGMIAAFPALIPGGLRFTIVSVIAEGDRVVVEAEGNAVTTGGTPYRNQYCFLFTLAGGKIVKVDEYFCTVLADAVLWPLVEGSQGSEGS
jgi:uncharacterized protein